MQNRQSAIAIQKYIRAYLVRQQLTVETLATGIVHIQIRGGADFLANIGIFELDTTRGNKQLDILSIAAKYFEGQVVGGHDFFNPVTAGGIGDKVSAEFIEFFGQHQTTVYINAGYFNNNGPTMDSFYQGYPPYAPVGPTVTNRSNHYVPLPAEYVDDFATLVFRNGTYVSLAPVLSWPGQAVFDNQKITQTPYQYATLRTAGPDAICPPGALYHADEPNPRAGIAIPDAHHPINQNRFRIAVATTTDRGPACNGFTLLEWQKVMERLSKLNNPPGQSMNLDGGSSVNMGVVIKEEKKFEVAQNKTGRYASTFLLFTNESNKDNNKESNFIKAKL